jgi:hypothetical protein
MYVAVNPERFYRLVEDCLETPLKQRPSPTVLSIEPNSVAYVDLEWRRAGLRPARD